MPRVRRADGRPHPDRRWHRRAATALTVLERRPGTSLLLLEEEYWPGAHQAGHDGGVVHAGIHHEPGSLKVHLCRQGERATKRVDEHGIPDEMCPGRVHRSAATQETGARAQTVRRAGSLVHDVLLERTVQASSAAATSAPPIGTMLAEEAVADV